MKRVLLLIAIACALSACKKSSTVNANVFGKYELRGSYGGLAYHHEQFQPGNGNIYQFRSDSTYTHHISDTNTKSGIFHIKITGTDNGARYGTIAFDTPDYPEAFQLKGDTIIIGRILGDVIAS